jgi:sulfur-oxidizing protein SoxX
MRSAGALLAAGCLLSCALVSGENGLHYEVVADTIPESLTPEPASPDRGREIFAGRSEGQCVLCHRVDGLNVPFQGNVGPDLSAVGSRLSPAQIRLRIVNASRLNPATLMPPYYRTTGLDQVAVEYRDRPALSAAQVEHLVAYLAALGNAVP